MGKNIQLVTDMDFFVDL